MILYGRMLSPFVRRVAIWLTLQGREFSLKELAATDPNDAEAMQKVHPGLRVPALEVDDGAILIETHMICDWLDDSMPKKRLIPATGTARRDCLQRVGLANATVEKVVALVYEKNRRPEEFHWKDWQNRVINQVTGGLTAMEASAPEAGFFGGDAPDAADIATVITYQMAEKTNPFLLDTGYPKLKALTDRALEIDAFASTRP